MSSTSTESRDGCVALARSLVTRPRLLLLDEPLSALDARIRKHLREQIRAIQKELGLTPSSSPMTRKKR